MKLSTQDIVRIVDALQHFDVKTEGGNADARPYKIAGTVRMAMAKNIARCGEVINAYQKARNALIYDLAGGGNQVPTDKLAEFEKGQQVLLDAMHDVSLIRLRESQLDLDANPVPLMVLTALIPIMIAEDNDAAAA